MKKLDSEMHSIVGLFFQEGTKYSRERMPASRLDYLDPPEPFKEYPDAPKIVALAAEKPERQRDFWEILDGRRSRRSFAGESISFPVLEALLWAMQGITARMGGFLLRTAPSAGALYPIETYLFANNVGDLPQGLYHLNVRRWRLEQIHTGDLGAELARAALDQAMVARASVTFIWTASIARCAWKYGQRAYRYIYLDAAHIAAHLYLAAEALDLGCCGIAALYDEEVNAVLDVDGANETTLYMAAVGPVRD